MAITHPLFCRSLPNGKAVLLTIVDSNELNIPEGDSFLIATTETNNPLNNGFPTITLKNDTPIPVEKYVKILQKHDVDVSSAIGDSIEQIAKRPYWFSRKFKSLSDLLN